MLPKIKIKEKLLNFKLREDRAILMVCIGIALVFWLLVKLSQQYSTQKEVAFELVIPEDKSFTNPPPNDLTVDIEGTGWDLLFEYFSNPEITLQYDLSQSEDLQINRGQLRNDIMAQLSSGDIKVTEVTYENINLELEQKIQRRVPVELRDSITLAPEYDLRGPVRVRPDSVLLTGPVSEVEAIRSWVTDSVVLLKVRSDQKRMIRLQEPPRGMELDTREVELQLEVEQYTEKSLFVRLAVENIPENDSLRYFPQQVKLTCVVGLSQYQAVDSSDFRLAVDLKGVNISQKRNTVPIQLTEKPAFVKNVNFSPKTAEFFFVKKEPPPD